MATGKTETLTGEITYTREHELSAYDDVLTISSATLRLLKPAGDLMLKQGNDTVTIVNSTIIGDTGVGVLLGSGDDTLTIQNSEIRSRISLAGGDDHVIINGSAQSVVTLTALDPDQTTVDTDEDLTTLSLGSGNDILELCSILEGTGVINFGSGSDTLVFNAGTLNNSGGIANLNNLTVTSLGGTTYRDLELVDAGNRIEWNGNLRGSDNAKWIILDAVSGTAQAEAAFITDNNVVSNIGFSIADRTFVQTDGGTWEISGRSDNAAFTADNSKVTLYHMVLTENKTGFSGSNTDWNLNKSNISNHSERGAVITGGSLIFSDIEFTENQSENLRNGAGVWLQGATVSGTMARVNRNRASASISCSSVIVSEHGDAFHSAFVGNVAVCGGGFYTEDSTVSLEDISYDGNVVVAEACCNASAWADVSSYASSDSYCVKNSSYAVSAIANAEANAAGGGWYSKKSELILEEASFYNNIASASVSASAYSFAWAWAHSSGISFHLLVSSFALAQPIANARGGGLYTENSTVSMKHIVFENNIAEACAGFNADARVGALAKFGKRVEGRDIAIASNDRGTYATSKASYAGSSASALGGGLYTQNSIITLEHATFSNNIATAQAVSGAGAFAGGGGMWMGDAQDTIFTDVKFYGNKALSNQGAQGGAAYLKTGALTLSAGIFASNQVSGNNAQGGAVYADSMLLNLTDTIFSDNTVNGEIAQGGALFITNGSRLVYSLSDNMTALQKTVTCSGNSALEGGFLYLENSAADFVIGSNTKLLISDSIAGSGTITKSGADMEISAAIADSNIRWTVASGLLELSTIARTINLNNWTIGTEAMLRLSSLNDVVNMSTDKKIGTLDLGGGSDVINTGGYTLSGGQLLVSTLTFSAEVDESAVQLPLEIRRLVLILHWQALFSTAG